MLSKALCAAPSTTSLSDRAVDARRPQPSGPPALSDCPAWRRIAGAHWFGCVVVILVFANVQPTP